MLWTGIFILLANPKIFCC